jgi:hypothetical protein
MRNQKASRSKIQLGGRHLFDGFLAGLKFSVYARTLVFVYATSKCAKEKREFMEQHVCMLIHVRAWERNRPLWLAGWPPSCAAPVRTRTRTLWPVAVRVSGYYFVNIYRLCWGHKTVTAARHMVRWNILQALWYTAIDIWITGQCMCVASIRRRYMD